MSEVEEIEPESRLDKAKEIVKKNWKVFAVGVVTGVTVVVAKRVILPNKTSILIRKMIIKDNVFLIETYARRQGPPSYLVECLETGEKWVTQSDAARDIGISISRLSACFAETNGKVAIVKGKHYVRRAIAIPKAS